MDHFLSAAVLNETQPSLLLLPLLVVVASELTGLVLGSSVENGTAFLQSGVKSSACRSFPAAYPRIRCRFRFNVQNGALLNGCQRASAGLQRLRRKQRAQVPVRSRGNVSQSCEMSPKIQREGEAGARRKEPRSRSLEPGARSLGPGGRSRGQSGLARHFPFKAPSVGAEPAPLGRLTFAVLLQV